MPAIDPMLYPADVAAMLTPPHRHRRFGYKRALALMKSGAIRSWKTDSGRWWTYEQCVVDWQRGRERNMMQKPGKCWKQTGNPTTARELIRTLRETTA